MSNIIDKIQVSGVTYDIGSQITIDPTLDSGSTNPVANSAITTALDAKVNVADNVVDFYEILSESQSGGNVYPKNVDGNHCTKWYYTTSGISTTTTYEVQNYIIPTTGGSGSFSLIIQLAIDNGVITGYTVTQDTFNALDSASVTNGVMEVNLKDDYYVEIIDLKGNNGLYTYNPLYTINENQSADALNEDIKGILESYWNNIGSSLKEAGLSYNSYRKGNCIRLNTRSNNGTQDTYFQLVDGVNMKYVYDGNSDNTISGKLIPIITSSVPSSNNINYNSTNTWARYLPSDYTTTTGNKSKQVTSVRAYVNTATTLSSDSDRNVTVYIQSWSGGTSIRTDSLTYNYTTGNTFTADTTTTSKEVASGFTHTYSGNVLTVTSTNPDVLIRYIRARVTSPDRAVDNSTDLLTDVETLTLTPIKTGQEAYNELDERINALTGHTADTTIHVTAQDKTNWNAKSDFSGSYNDLTNKLSAGTNITIVDNVISATGGGTVSTAITSGDTNAVAGGVLFDELRVPTPSEVETVLQWNNHDEAETTNYPSGLATKIVVTTDTDTYNSFEFRDEGSNIVGSIYITNTNGEVTASTYVEYGTITYSVSGNVVTVEYPSIAADIDYIYSYYNQEWTVKAYSSGGIVYEPLIDHVSANTESIQVLQEGKINTSDITTAITISSTDDKVPSAKAVYDKLGGLSLRKLTQTQYDNLQTKDNMTLYVIVN